MHLLRSFLFGLSVLTVSLSNAQLNSPYSRIGLGNIYTPTMGGSTGMAGATQANFLTNEISAQNPASYCFLFKSVLDVGVYGRSLTLNDGTDQFTSGDGNLSNIAFGFSPDNSFSRHDFGFSTGILPVSAAQYIIESTTPSADTLLGNQTTTYTGTGGLYKYFVGLAYGFETNRDTVITTDRNRKTDTTTFYRNEFAFGANYEFTFGSIVNSTVAAFPDQANSVDTKYERSTSMQGSGFNAGFGYQRRMGNNYNMNLGVSYAPAVNLDGTQSVSWYNINQIGTVQQITDTLFFAPDSSGKITTAPNLHLGISFNNYRQRSIDSIKYMVSAEFSLSDWSQYTGFLYSDSLNTYYRMKLGAELIPPRRDEVGKSLVPIAYRFGFHYGKSYLEVDGKHLDEIGMTFGMGIPMRGSRLNLGLGVMQRGATDLIKENYVNFQLGFNISDYNWFIKRKQN